MVSCPSPQDATSFYRGMGPMLMLEKQYPEVELIIGPQDAKDYDWQFLRRVDLLFFQRPCIPIHQKIMERAIQNKIPIWVDFDDDLLSVPKDNPTSGVYNTHAVATSVINCLKLATIVTTSTKHLKAKFSQFNPNIEVVPNALDETLFKPLEIKPRSERRPTILWRGSTSHLGDLLTYQKAMKDIMRAHPKWFWLFMGYEPWFLTQDMTPGSYGVAPWAGHMEYFELLQKVAAPVSIVPLKDNEFNRAKSNIAWIESTLAGSAVLCPDWEEWQRPGAVNYKDPDHFLDLLDRMLTEKIDTEECRTKSWADIETNLFLSKTNELRYNIAKRFA